jgi:hypothetical protein
VHKRVQDKEVCMFENWTNMQQPLPPEQAMQQQINERSILSTWFFSK